MKKLGEIRHSQIINGAPDKDPADFRVRRAARAIVTDDAGRVALLYVGKYNYHKLPGGGVEGDENIEQALERELLEEIGCRAEVTAEVGEIVEYRDEWDMKQTSYCYVAKQIGEAGSPDFTQKELDDEFAVVWAKDIAEAVNLLGQDTPEDYGGKFIVARDLAFLQAAREIVPYR